MKVSDGARLAGTIEKKLLKQAEAAKPMRASKDDFVQSVQPWDGVPDQSANAEDALEDTLTPVG